MVAKEKNDIVLAIPSKGSLYEGTLSFLTLAGVPVKYGNQRQYTARLGGVKDFSVLFQRAEEVPQKVLSGAADLGLTGEDLFREHGSDELILVVKTLGFGHARLVVAVPNTWIDVSSMEELADLALSFRLKHDRNLRIATRFPNLSRGFLASHNIIDYSLVESLGATESAPSSGAADLVIDLAASGKTLVENHLRVLKEGTVISSQACLIASRRISSWNTEKLESLEIFLDLLESYLRGKEIYHLQATVPRSKFTELVGHPRPWRLTYSIPGEEMTPSKLKREPVVLVRITSLRSRLYETMRQLRESGAEEIIVTQPEYVFRAESEAYQQLKHMLRKGGNPE